jgi:flagellar protein FliS
MHENAFLAYQTNSARGASPVGQVVALYDTILRDFRRAAAALDAGNVEARVFELNHAITVIGHLRSVLDHQRGGEAARRLERFYDVTHSMIVQANLSPSRESIQRLADLYSSVRQAWHQAERQLPPFSAENPADRSLAQTTTPAAETTASASVRWSA